MTRSLWKGVEDLYCGNLAKLKLHFPELPSLYSSNLAGIMGHSAYHSEGESRIIFSLIWKVGVECKVLLQLIHVSPVCWITWLACSSCRAHNSSSFYQILLQLLSLPDWAWLTLSKRYQLLPRDTPIIKLRGLKVVRLTRVPVHLPWFQLSITDSRLFLFLPLHVSFFLNCLPGPSGSSINSLRNNHLI